MNVKKLILILIIFIITFFTSGTVLGVPANPAPFMLTQPDNSTFQARQVGDERGAHFETLDGYTIVKDEAGVWNYARIDEKGELAPAGHKVGQVEPERTALKKHLRQDISAIETTSVKSAMAVSRAPAPSMMYGPAMAPQVGTKKALVILIKFKDRSQESSHTPAYYNNLLFSASADSMNKYYKEVSYGKIDIAGDVAGNRWYNSAFKESDYGKDYSHNPYHDDYYGPVFRLAVEALKLADSDVNFALYDTNSNGVLNSDELSIIIVHAGCGEEDNTCARWSTDSIWSHSWFIQGSPFGCSDCIDVVLDGVRISKNYPSEDISGYTMQAEDSPLGIFAHEFGHDLGLPDLYDIDYSSWGVGYWDLMGYGSWLNNGNTPAHLSAWSKYFLGWIVPTNVTTSLLNKQIKNIETNGDVYILPDNPGGTLDWDRDGNGRGEYFLVENRRKTGYDAYLPGEGLLIWHIDEAIGNNNNENHKLVDLEEADGLNQLDSQTNYGDAFDSWNNSIAGFTETSTPNSKLYNGSKSGVRVADISASGSTMTADLIVGWPPPVITFVPSTPANNSNLSRNWLYINISSNEALDKALLEWNGKDESMIFSGINWYKNMTDVVDSVYTYRVRANDSTGNMNFSSKMHIIVDSTPPKVTIYPTLYQHGNAANINSVIRFNISASDNMAGLKNASLDAFPINNTGIIELTNQSGFWRANVTFDKFVSDGEYSLKVKFFDFAGNLNDRDDINVSIDNNPPSVTDVDVSSSFIKINSSVDITAKIISGDERSILNESEIFARVTYPNETSIDYPMNLKSGIYGCKFNDTGQYGTYTATIHAGDTTGNTNSTQKTQFSTNYMLNKKITVTGGANETLAIGNTTLILSVNDLSSGSVNINQSIVNLTSDELAYNPGIYVLIDIKDISVSYAIVRINYSDAEVSSLVESSLRLHRWNTTSSKWEKLSAPGSPSYVNDAGVDTANNFVWANLTSLSEFGMSGDLYVPPQQQQQSSGGGGGGGGGGPSGENFTNIEVKERYDLHVLKDELTSFRFTNRSNPVMFVNFTGNTSAGEVSTTVEVLKNTSSLLKDLTPGAPGIVYKNINVWVGTSGFAVPKNIREPVIKFRVENSWISGNNLESSDVRMVRWDGSKWEPLETVEKAKDGAFTYYEAKVGSFSHFAITGPEEEVQAAPPPPLGTITMSEPAPAVTGMPFEEGPTMNWALILIGMIVLIAIVAAIYFIRK